MGSMPGGGLSRRRVLAGAAALPLTAGTATPEARVRPGRAGWPGPDAWAALGRAVGGKLAPVALPDLPAARAAGLLHNPFYLDTQAALTQSSGWVDAWTSAPSAWCVRPAAAADVAAAVRFAARHRLRLVVRGGGHSYLGGSNAPDSLLIWLRDMRDITLHERFVPAGSGAAPLPAVSVGAGCLWGEVYEAVAVRGGRYVQGGGCTTVGVAGLVQGGGFGHFSKQFGTAAASLIEAEVVTADGAVRVVNAAREPELFWALKGGGGGTFGVVTRLTLATHDLPATIGAVKGVVRATSDAAFRRLLAAFLDLYAARLANPHWGEQAIAGTGNRMEFTMLFQGIDEGAARAAWAPFFDFVAAHEEDYRMEAPFVVLAVPGRRFWDGAFWRAHRPDIVTFDTRPGGDARRWHWAGNTGEAGAFWHGYQSLWLPRSLLAKESRAPLVDAWFAASRAWTVEWHFNKGLAFGAPEALAASRATATHPEVLDAFALAIIAEDGETAYGGLTPGAIQAARADARAIETAMAALRRVAPGGGSYLSECDYHLADWPRACWGANWPRLSAVKRRYDPDGLFVVHHGVGSEAWSADGFTRLG